MRQYKLEDYKRINNPRLKQEFKVGIQIEILNKLAKLVELEERHHVDDRKVGKIDTTKLKKPIIPVRSRKPTSRSTSTKKSKGDTK